jgi:hypothetical protein
MKSWLQHAGFRQGSLAIHQATICLFDMNSHD